MMVMLMGSDDDDDVTIMVQLESHCWGEIVYTWQEVFTFTFMDGSCRIIGTGCTPIGSSMQRP